MAWGIFDSTDMLRPLLEHLSAAGPPRAMRRVEAAADAGVHVEEHAAPLPVDVHSVDKPEGVPLHSILKAIQDKVPGVKSLVVRDNRLFIGHADSPTDEDRARVARILSDKATLETLRAAPAGDAVPADLEKTLLDDATPDAAWMRAFRRYAVSHLISRR
jgi:hypothetical protein